MSNRKIFVNLIVADLPRSKSFFEAIGFHFNPQFTSDEAACMVVSDDAYFMLHTPGSMKRFSPKPAPDHATHLSGIFAFSVGGRDEVDRVAEAAFAAGATPFNPPTDHGFMYLRSFLDPDGQSWEVFWMDVAQATGG